MTGQWGAIAELRLYVDCSTHDVAVLRARSINHAGQRIAANFDLPAQVRILASANFFVGKAEGICRRFLHEKDRQIQCLTSMFESCLPDQFAFLDLLQHCSAEDWPLHRGPML